MTRRDLVRSLVIAVIFSTAILLILGISEHTGQLWFGGYFFVFAVVAYGMMGFFVDYGPTHLPVIVAWLTMLPAMVIFYWPVTLLLMLLWRKARRSGSSEAELAHAAERAQRDRSVYP